MVKLEPKKLNINSEFKDKLNNIIGGYANQINGTNKDNDYMIVSKTESFSNNDSVSGSVPDAPPLIGDQIITKQCTSTISKTMVMKSEQPNSLSDVQLNPKTIINQSHDPAIQAFLTFLIDDHVKKYNELKEFKERTLANMSTPTNYVSLNIQQNVCVDDTKDITPNNESSNGIDPYYFSVHKKQTMEIDYKIGSNGNNKISPDQLLDKIIFGENLAFSKKNNDSSDDSKKKKKHKKRIKKH